jgi:hypothetical protein
MSVTTRNDRLLVNANSGWIFTLRDINDSPSRAAGIDNEGEQKLRREGCNIIWNVGSTLKLKENPTLYTACTFFHRFYMVQSFKEYPLEVAALGCLFLAGKVEETPKKCRDVVNVAKEVLPDKYNSATLLQDVFQFERILLSTLGFDLNLENPYTFLMKYAKIFNIESTKKREIVQFAWTFLNDCAGTTLCLQYEPEIIAIAILQLGFKFHKMDMTTISYENKSDGSFWWDNFVEGMQNQHIDDVCHFALDYYENISRRSNTTMENGSALENMATSP